MSAILNQQQFCERFYMEFGQKLQPLAVKRMIAAGMPIIKAVSAKPRFHWEKCREWVLAGQGEGGLEQEARDRLFKRSIAVAL